MAWGITPKHHMCQTMMERCARSRMSAAYHWCFAYQDCDGTMVRATASRFIERYCVHLWSNHGPADTLMEHNGKRRRLQ